MSTAAAIACSAVLGLPAQAQEQLVPEGPRECGPVATPYHYGPFDYRTQKDKLIVVETFHFTTRVEMLLSGESGSDPGGDLNYTLLSSPNHARALVALIRLVEKLKSPKPPGLEYSILCFLERGVRFQPEDTVVRQLYAEYLGTHGFKNEALRHLDIAVTFAEDNPITHFNIGLLYFKFGSYEKALQQAHDARRYGWPRTDLEDKLKSVNQWREPAP